MITYTLRLFDECEKIDEIIIPAEPDYFDLLEKIKIENNFSKITRIIPGGTTRQESVYNGLKSLRAEQNDLVAVHDAARPLLDKKILSNALNTAENSDNNNAVPAVNGKDTVVLKNDSSFEYLNRENLFYVQTPQIFRYKILMKAFEKAAEENFTGTDESMLVSRTGERINFVEGSYKNFKITTSDDLALLEHIISANS